MKSREAFKQSIFEKRERYLRQKKARQRRLAALLPACAVVLAAGIGIWHRSVPSDGVPTELCTDMSGSVPEGARAHLMAALFRYPSAEPVGVQTGQPAEALYDFLTTLTFDESFEEADTIPDETSLQEGYRIELDDEKGTVFTAIYYENGVLCVGDATHTLTEAQNRQLWQLVSALIQK